MNLELSAAAEAKMSLVDDDADWEDAEADMPSLEVDAGAASSAAMGLPVSAPPPQATGLPPQFGGMPRPGGPPQQIGRPRTRHRNRLQLASLDTVACPQTPSLSSAGRPYTRAT